MYYCVPLRRTHSRVGFRDSARRFGAFVFWLGLGCAPAPSTHPPNTDRTAFDGEAALARTAQLVNLPRTLGAPARGQAIEELANLFAQATKEPPTIRRQQLTGTDPKTNERYPLTNLIVDYRPHARRSFVLATHFDTRPWAEQDPDPAQRLRPIEGANDGTSGLAVLLELVPVLDRQLPPDIGFTVIAFDGEELGRPGYGGYCAGSLALGKAIGTGQFGDLVEAEFGIVLDMVGGRGQTLPMEPNSLQTHPELVKALWGLAADHKLPGFVGRVHRTGIYDDHIPLSDAGIPSVLLIDHDYPHWHTQADTLDKLSDESLASVGEALRLYIVDRYAP